MNEEEKALNEEHHEITDAVVIASIERFKKNVKESSEQSLYEIDDNVIDGLMDWFFDIFFMNDTNFTALTEKFNSNIHLFRSVYARIVKTIAEEIENPTLPITKELLKEKQ